MERDRFEDAPAARKKALPFEFVLDALAPVAPTTNPMFGCTAVYVGERIVMILRDKGDVDSGMWLVSEPEHHASLRPMLPSMRPIVLIGDRIAGWMCIPEDGDGFEDEALRACALICAGDPRIGRVPKKKQKKPAAKKPATKKPAAKKPAAKKPARGG